MVSFSLRKESESEEKGFLEGNRPQDKHWSEYCEEMEFFACLETQYCKLRDNFSWDGCQPWETNNLLTNNPLKMWASSTSSSNASRSTVQYNSRLHLKWHVYVKRVVWSLFLIPYFSRRWISGRLTIREEDIKDVCVVNTLRRFSEVKVVQYNLPYRGRWFCWRSSSKYWHKRRKDRLYFGIREETNTI